MVSWGVHVHVHVHVHAYVHVHGCVHVHMHIHAPSMGGTSRGKSALSEIHGVILGVAMKVQCFGHCRHSLDWALGHV